MSTRDAVAGALFLAAVVVAVFVIEIFGGRFRARRLAALTRARERR